MRKRARGRSKIGWLPLAVGNATKLTNARRHTPTPREEHSQVLRLGRFQGPSLALGTPSFVNCVTGRLRTTSTTGPLKGSVPRVLGPGRRTPLSSSTMVGHCLRTGKPNSGAPHPRGTVGHHTGWRWATDSDLKTKIFEFQKPVSPRRGSV